MKTSPDIDCGWAYTVLAGYIFIRFLVLGITWSPGILYNDLLDCFEKSPVLTAWAINLNTFVTYASASIASGLIKTYGPRVSMVIGCFFSTLGLIVTSFAPSLEFVFIFFGFVTGFGFSMVNVSSYPVVTSYFSEYRVVVLLLASSAGGCGQFILPLLFFWLSNTYTWRGALLIIAALNLNFLATAAIYMPPRMESDETDGHTMQTSETHGSLSDPQSITSNGGSCIKTFLIDDWTLFRNSCFVLVFFSYFFVTLGYNGMCTLIKAYGLYLGMTDMEATTLLSFVGLSSLLGTGAMTLLSRAPRVSVMISNVLFLFGTGAATITLGLVDNKTGTFVAIALVGFFSGSLDALPVVILTVVGVDDIAAGIGYASISVAIGCLAGGSIGAELLIVDPTYLTSFVTLGIVCIFGASLQVPIVFARSQAG